MNTKISSVDQYISSFPKEVQILLERIRSIILNQSNDISESISYGIPTYKTFGKALVHFAAYQHHIGLYATPSGHAQFTEELAPYKQGKASVQFPFSKPIPYEIIEKMVHFRVEENRLKFSK